MTEHPVVTNSRRLHESSSSSDVLVSVVVSYRDARTTIEDMVKSVYAQTLQDWELILLDDGSTDETHALLSRITDPRVRTFRDGLWKGTAARRNELTELSRGKYLAVMDADDIMHPMRLERQVETLELSGADVVGGGMYTIGFDLSLTGARRPRPVPDSARDVIRHGLLLHAASMGRRQWFIANPYDERFVRAQDYELWCRTFATSSFVVSSDPMIYCREGVTVSLDKYRRSCRANRQVIALHGPQFGRTFMARETLRSYAKEATYVAMSAIRMNKALVSRRNVRTTDEESSEARNQLERVRETQVPGWD